MNVGNSFFMPSGDVPPRTYPVTAGRSCQLSSASDFSPAARAAFLRSSSQATGMQKTE